MPELDRGFLKQVALNLKAIRNQQNMRQVDVLNQTNIHIGRIESGRANVKLSTLKTLAEFYGVPMQRLFEGIAWFYDDHKLIQPIQLNL